MKFAEKVDYAAKIKFSKVTLGSGLWIALQMRCKMKVKTNKRSVVYWLMHFTGNDTVNFNGS